MDEHKRIICAVCNKPVDAIEQKDMFDAPGTVIIRVFCHGDTEERTFLLHRSVDLKFAETLYTRAFIDTARKAEGE